MMKTFTELTAALVTRAGSERKAAALVGISPTSFNAWIRGRALPDDEQARKVAELLELPDSYVVALTHRERAKTDATKKMWQRMADRFKDAAVVAGFGLVTAMGGGFNNTAFAANSAPHLSDGNTHCRVKRRRWCDGVAP